MHFIFIFISDSHGLSLRFDYEFLKKKKKQAVVTAVDLLLAFFRTSKVKNKGPKDIMATEDMNGEVRFSAHLHYPNNLSR